MSENSTTGERITIAYALVKLLTSNPLASDGEMTEVALSIMPHSTYKQSRCQPDRRKFNAAKFTCQRGVIPVTKAVNPIGRPLQQSKDAVEV